MEDRTRRCIIPPPREDHRGHEGSTNGNHRDDPWTIPERDPERDLDALDRAWGRNYSEPSPPPNSPAAQPLRRMGMERAGRRAGGGRRAHRSTPVSIEPLSGWRASARHAAPVYGGPSGGVGCWSCGGIRGPRIRGWPRAASPRWRGTPRRRPCSCVREVPREPRPGVAPAVEDHPRGHGAGRRGLAGPVVRYARGGSVHGVSSLLPRARSGESPAGRVSFLGPGPALAFSAGGNPTARAQEGD